MGSTLGSLSGNVNSLASTQAGNTGFTYGQLANAANSSGNSRAFIPLAQQYQQNQFNTGMMQGLPKQQQQQQSGSIDSILKALTALFSLGGV